MSGRGVAAPVPICAGLLVERRAEGVYLLLGKRAAGRAFYPGVWDLIGGHVEAGETPEDALVREIREEIGVTPLAWRAVAREVVPAAGEAAADLEFWLYAVTDWSGTPHNRLPEEHAAIAWFGVEEACRLELADKSYPDLFHTVMDRLQLREVIRMERTTPGSVAAELTSLDEVRTEIDRIDGVLVGLLAERAAYVRRAGELKRTEAEARAPARVEAVIARVRDRAEAVGLSPEVAERTWRAMIAAFIDQEIADIAARQEA